MMRGLAGALLLGLVAAIAAPAWSETLRLEAAPGFALVLPSDTTQTGVLVWEAEPVESAFDYEMHYRPLGRAVDLRLRSALTGEDDEVALYRRDDRYVLEEEGARIEGETVGPDTFGFEGRLGDRARFLHHGARLTDCEGFTMIVSLQARFDASEHWMAEAWPALVESLEGCGARR